MRDGIRLALRRPEPRHIDELRLHHADAGWSRFTFVTLAPHPLKPRQLVPAQTFTLDLPIEDVEKRWPQVEAWLTLAEPGTARRASFKHPGYRTWPVGDAYSRKCIFCPRDPITGRFIAQ